MIKKKADEIYTTIIKWPGQLCLSRNDGDRMECVLKKTNILISDAEAAAAGGGGGGGGGGTSVSAGGGASILKAHSLQLQNKVEEERTKQRRGEAAAKWRSGEEAHIDLSHLELHKEFRKQRREEEAAAAAAAAAAARWGRRWGPAANLAVPVPPLPPRFRNISHGVNVISPLGLITSQPPRRRREQTAP